jgi:GTP-binding protein
MPSSRALPTVVIVGRPNVGKSTLFNRITGQRRSIVGDEPGITRDRVEGLATHKGRRFQLIDTGGVVVQDAGFIPAQILKQAKVALSRAHHILFLIDGRSEITGADRDLAQLLLKLGRPLTLVVNKIDTREREDLANEFYVLGIQDLFPVSAEHAMGIEALLDHVVSSFPPHEPEYARLAEAAETRRYNDAIIGHPNTGKTTKLNAFTGAERSIVSPVAGTTRDAVDETVVHNGIEYVLVDTAGIRRKGKTTLMTEKLSVVMARRHIRMADVVLVVLDATEGVLALDATIAGYAHEGGRAIIICVNKWDRVPEKGKRKFEQNLRDQMKFIDYAPVTFLSAKTGEGVKGLFKLIREVDDSASKRITTGELNRFVESLHFEDRKIFYVTQASIRPPAFVFFTNSTGALHFSHERYLANQIRKRFGFRGAPVVVKTRTKRQK